MNAAHRRGVEQHIDEVVVQEVHLVDVQNTAVGRGEQTRLKGPLTVPKHLLQIEGTDDAVLGCADR